MDLALAFFLNSYHLRDWLVAEDVRSATELNQFFERRVELRICRDVCNRSKHRRIDRRPLDADYSIGREYTPRDARGERFFLIAAGEKYDLVALADRCLKAWEELLAMAPGR